MPLVRIDHAQSHPEGFGRAVGEIVYRAMMRKLIHVVFGVLKSGLPFDVSKHMKVSTKALA